MKNEKSAEKQGGSERGAEWASVSEVEFKGGLEKRGVYRPSGEAKVDSGKNDEKEMLKVPKVVEFPTGAKDELLRAGKLKGMVAYPISDEKMGAVERGKATWSFINQVFEAENPKEFRSANLLARAVETAPDVLPEELDQIREFKESPAYQIKQAGFSLDEAQRRVDNGDLGAKDEVARYKTRLERLMAA